MVILLSTDRQLSLENNQERTCKKGSESTGLRL